MQIDQYGFDVVFVDKVQVGVGNVQVDEVVFIFDLEVVILQIWQEVMFCFIVGMGNFVFNYWGFICYLVDLCYDWCFRICQKKVCEYN